MRAAIAILIVLVLAACAPAVPAGQGGASSREPVPSVRKVLTVALQTEPTSFDPGIIGGRLSGEGGVSNFQYFANDALAVEIENDTYIAQLATQLPSFEGGTWQVNADGTMDTTWRLQPNARWHDGTPFTSQDLVFTFTVYTDPDFPTRAEGRPLMESVSAPDAQTFVVHWKSAFVNAYREPPGDDVMPRHLLEELYRTDKNAFVNSPYFRSDFIGLGPYRLTQWVQGSHVEFARFDDYYQGRPPLATIIVKFIGDPNSMAAAILAGSVDVTLPPAIDVETAFEVQRRWEGTTNQVRADPNGKVSILDPQVRSEYARPRNGFTNPLVRQAFYHGLDRQTIASIQTHGLAPIADSYFPPTDPLRPELDPYIPQFPYDPARAQALLVQAGWIRGSDGMLVNQATGDRFETEARGGQGAGNERMLSLIAENWKAIGADTAITVIPAARLGDREYAATRPGFNVTNPSGPPFYERNRLHSSQITAESNRWTGINSGGYSNPKVDALLDELRGTLDQRGRLALNQQLVREQIGDVAVMPLYWEVFTVLMLSGVKGPKTVKNSATQNIFEWDKA